MPHFDVLTDTETAERIGASGTWQVISITDEDGNDVTDDLKIDAGRHYSSEDELGADIAKALNIEADDVSLDVE